MPPDPTLRDFNPYQSPADLPSVEKPVASSRPVTLIVLTVLAGEHLLVSAAMLLGGLLAGHGPLLASALVCSGFYVAIFIGLVGRREWARVMLIWLCYVGIVSYLIQSAVSPRVAPVALVLMVFEIATLILAHSPSVRETTRGASLPKEYTYHESPSTAKEDA
jgi:hypothetical protein